MNKQIEKLKAKQAEIRAKIKALETRTFEKTKKSIDEKRKIVGNYLLNKYKDKMDELKRLLDPALKKVRERKLFGLKPKIEEKKEEADQSSTPFWKK